MQRHLREAGITPREARGVMADFVEDEEAGVWSWLPVTSTLIRRVCDRVATLPRGLLLRAGDAIHLGCARLVVPPRDANTGSNPVGATIPISSVISLQVLGTSESSSNMECVPRLNCQAFSPPALRRTHRALELRRADFLLTGTSRRGAFDSHCR